MKTIGRMVTSQHLNHCKTGEVRLSKNMIIDKDKQSRIAELGEKRVIITSTLGLSNSTIVGVINCNTFDVVICTWDYDKLCIIKQTTASCEIILKTQYIRISNLEIVEGVFQTNNLGETIIAFWNGTQEGSMLPRLINIDSLPFSVDANKEITGSGISLSELTLLQLNRNEPSVNPQVMIGQGSLPSGKYSFCLNYVLDEDESSTTIPSRSIFIETIEHIYLNEERSNFRGEFWNDSVCNYSHINYKSSTPQSIVNSGITIYFSNLDTRYSKFHLNVLHFNSGTITAYRVKDIVFDSDTLQYHFNTLLTSDKISLDSILQSTFSLDKIQSGKSFKNKLYVGGFKEIDYEYQPFANAITVKLGIREKSYTGITTFTPDEAYAFYAHVLYKNGKIGKGNFISGRLPQGTELDTCDNIIYGNLDGHGCELNDATQYKQFHVRSELDGGNIGFWENTNYTYDNWLLKNRKVFTLDSNGDPLDTNTYINDVRNNLRLIRFPDIIQIGAIMNDYGGINNHAKQYEIYPIFENIKIPNDLKEIAQGLIFTYAKKGSQDFHVLGYGDGALRNWYADYPEIDLTNWINMHSFDMLTLKSNVTPLCLKDLARIGKTDTGYDTYHLLPSYTLDAIYPIRNVSYLPANNSATAGYTNGGNEEKIHVRLGCSLLRTFGCAAAASHIGFDIRDMGAPVTPYQDILQVWTWKQMHSFLSMISNSLDLHENCLNTELVNMDTTVIFTSSTTYTTNGLIPKGDTYIEDEIVRLVARDINDDGIHYNIWHMTEQYPTYSRLAIQLREFTDVPVINQIKYFLEVTRIFYFNHYNMYYEGRKLDTERIPNVENLAINKNPNYGKYLVRSNIISVDDNTVGWRTYLPLTSKNTPNFLITDLDKGDILHLEVSNKMMYIQTTETLFLSAIQEKLTSQIALEESDLFTITPNELIISNDERVSCYHKTACILTPNGLVVVNRRTSKIYIIGEGITEITQEGCEDLLGSYISNSGYRSTTKDNISIGYDLEYDKITFCFNNLYQNNPTINLLPTPMSIYDLSNTILPLGGLNELIVDSYLPIINNNELYLGKILYHKNSFSIDCTTLVDYFGNTVTPIKEQLCFNYMKGLGWISYSTHRFDRILNNSNEILGISGNMFLKLNDKVEFGSLINGEPYECFTDFIFNLTDQPLNSIISEVNLKTLCKNGTDVIDPDITVNAYAVYTENQCSGIVDINDFTNSIVNNLITRVHDSWNLNLFKDKVTDYRLPFSDKLGTFTNINTMMPWFKQSNFHSKVFVVRLMIKNAGLIASKDIHEIKLLDININMNKHLR